MPSAIAHLLSHSCESKNQMTTIPRVALLIILFSLPALGQSSGYSYDNFDTAKGVKVSAESPGRNGNRPARRNRTALTVMTKANGKADQPLSTSAAAERSLVNANIATYGSFATLANNSSALRGFTTGNSQVDELLINSGRNNGVDPLLLYSIMHQESSFKPHAISPKG